MSYMKVNLNFNLEDLKILYYVVKEGGFLKAARALNIPQGTVSRRILHLNHVFGTRLFFHDMRDMILTPTGAKAFKMAESVLGTVTQTHAEIQSEHTGMAGLIHLTVAKGFGNFWLNQYLAKFLKANPDLRMGFRANELGDGNLMMGETDVVICCVQPEPRENLVCEVLCEYPFQIYASQDYLDEKGIPTSVADLDHHRIVSWQEPVPLDKNFQIIMHALLTLGRDPKDPPRVPVFSAEDDLSNVMAVVNGVGLGSLPIFFTQWFPQLVRVPLQGEEEIFGKHFNKKFIVYSKVLAQSTRHQALIQFIKEKVQNFFNDTNTNVTA